MTEKEPEAKKREKRKFKRKKGVSNVEPAEEPTKGPTGEDIYRAG